MENLIDLVQPNDEFEDFTRHLKLEAIARRPPINGYTGVAQ